MSRKTIDMDSDDKIDMYKLAYSLYHGKEDDEFIYGPYGPKRLSMDSSLKLYHTYAMSENPSDYPYYVYRFFSPQNYIFLNPNPIVDHHERITSIQSSLDMPASIALMRHPFTFEELNNTLNQHVSPELGEDAETFYPKFIRWMLWSSIADTLLSFVAMLSDTLLRTVNFGISEMNIPPKERVQGFITLITGGLALRAYYPSHYSDDIDIKFFPRNMNTSINHEEFFRDFVDWANTLMIPFLNGYGRMMVWIYVQYAMQHPIIQMNPYMIRFYQDVLNSTADDYHVELSHPPYNPNVYKLIIRYKGRIYPMMDFTLYDSTDTVYSTLVRESRKRASIEFSPETIQSTYPKAYQVQDPNQDMIPFRIIPVVYLIPKDVNQVQFNPISLNQQTLQDVQNNKDTASGIPFKKRTTRFCIPDKEFIKAEKELLVQDLMSGQDRFNQPPNEDSRMFLINKFSRSLQTIQSNEKSLMSRNNYMPRTYVGGNGKMKQMKQTTRQTRKRTRK